MINIPLEITKRLRARVAIPFVPNGEVHIDIGCGKDKYFLSKSPCKTKIGIDMVFGDYVCNKIPINDNYADIVSMLAVLEHLEHPEAIIIESYRILKKGGILIITTPVILTHWISRIYCFNYEGSVGKHVRYFDYYSLKELAGKVFVELVYKRFEFGLNQLFVLKK